VFWDLALPKVSRRLSLRFGHERIWVILASQVRVRHERPKGYRRIALVSDISVVQEGVFVRKINIYV
jgi:hypothetical protein